jgi:hypothetical protein
MFAVELVKFPSVFVFLEKIFISLVKILDFLFVRYFKGTDLPTFGLHCLKKKQSAVILIYVPLYVMCSFIQATFKISVCYWIE